MTELGIQAAKARLALEGKDVDLEAEKLAAIAKCRRRIDVARDLFADGDISREEYLRRKEQNEREITHWEARTTETEKIALELALCLEAVEKISQLWEISDDEDKQGMARNLFSYIVYDLDTQRIVDFRLKPWADRFITLRAALYAENEGSKNSPDMFQGEGKRIAPTGFDITRLPSLNSAIQKLLELHYWGIPLPPKPISHKTPTKTDRNRRIRERFANGETIADLARDYGLTDQRVSQIIHFRNN